MNVESKIETKFLINLVSSTSTHKLPLFFAYVLSGWVKPLAEEVLALPGEGAGTNKEVCTYPTSLTPGVGKLENINHLYSLASLPFI